jgi:hypothetical protein
MECGILAMNDVKWMSMKLHSHAKLALLDGLCCGPVERSHGSLSAMSPREFGRQHAWTPRQATAFKGGYPENKEASLQLREIAPVPRTLSGGETTAEIKEGFVRTYSESLVLKQIPFLEIRQRDTRVSRSWIVGICNKSSLPRRSRPRCSFL